MTLNRFCAFWKSKLETLEIKPCQLYFENPPNLNLLDLLKSLDLIRLTIEHPLLCMFKDIALPSCFQKVAELHLNFVDLGEFRNQIFTQLENNNNIKMLSVPLYSNQVLMELTNFIKKRKSDTGFRFTFGLESYRPDWESKDGHQEFREFVNSIVASKSKIRLVDIDDLGQFIKFINEQITRDSCITLLQKIESARTWTPTEDTLSLLESLPGIRIVGLIDFRRIFDDSDRVTFPPLLEKLDFAGRFPACGSLPQSLTSFTLIQGACCINSLISSLNLLRDRCIQLSSLQIHIQYWPSAEERSVVNFERSREFINLRKLTCNYCIKVEESSFLQMEENRAAFVELFDFQNLELTELELNFLFEAEESHKTKPLMDERILKQLCERPSAKSLCKIQISNFCVTTNAIPLLEKLRSLAEENLKNLNERQGCTRRQRKN